MPQIIPPSKGSKRSRVAEYILLGVAALSLAFATPETIKTPLWFGVTIGVGAFLLAGFVSAYFAKKYKFRGEWVGSILTTAALGTCTVALISSAFLYQRPTIVFFACIFAAYTCARYTRTSDLDRLVDSQVKPCADNKIEAGGND